jgi:hypothetical protein
LKVNAILGLMFRLLSALSTGWSKSALPPGWPFLVFITAFKPFNTHTHFQTASIGMVIYSIKAAASAPIPPTNAPIPAVAIAPEPSAAVVAAAPADSLGVADAESE